DLLAHGGLVAGLVGGLGVPVDLGDLALDGVAVGVHERDLFAAGRDDLAVLDVLDAAGVGEEGRDGRGEEGLTLAAADDQRALLARADQAVGLVAGQGDERVVALELVVGQADG